MTFIEILKNKNTETHLTTFVKFSRSRYIIRKGKDKFKKSNLNQSTLQCIHVWLSRIQGNINIIINFVVTYIILVAHLLYHKVMSDWTPRRHFV